MRSANWKRERTPTHQGPTVIVDRWTRTATSSVGAGAEGEAVGSTCGGARAAAATWLVRTRHCLDLRWSQLILHLSGERRTELTAFTRNP
jgi:hypothetical protein